MSAPSQLCLSLRRAGPGGWDGATLRSASSSGHAKHHVWDLSQDQGGFLLYRDANLAYRRCSNRRVKYRCPISECCFLLLLVGTIALLAGCGRSANSVKEIAYVSAPQAFLRDQVAAVFNKTGTVKNGEAVQVLGRDRRFAHVRTSTGTEGWLEQRFLVSKDTYDAFQKL